MSAPATPSANEPSGCRFITIALQEPSKEAVLAWEGGGPRPPREAEAVLLDRNRAETVEAVVSLDAGAVTAWTVRTGVQPMAVVKELMEAEEVLRLHPEFQAALARRGVTDPGQIQVDAWPAGHFGREEESERRLARGVAFVKPAPGDNEWAHPVDGVIALVDLNTLEVLRVEDHGVVPVPQESGNFDAAAAGRLRTTSPRSRSPSRTGRGSPSTAASSAGSAGRCTSASRRARASC